MCLGNEAGRRRIDGSLYRLAGVNYVYRTQLRLLRISHAEVVIDILKAHCVPWRLRQLMRYVRQYRDIWEIAAWIEHATY